MNNNYNFTDLAFEQTFEMEASTMINEDYVDYLEEDNLNFFGVCSNLTYTNLNFNTYEN